MAHADQHPRVSGAEGGGEGLDLTSDHSRTGWWIACRRAVRLNTSPKGRIPASDALRRMRNRVVHTIQGLTDMMEGSKRGNYWDTIRQCSEVDHIDLSYISDTCRMYHWASLHRS